ncbi:PAS domain S-box protein [Sodalis sp. dw_96]|uniref:PAS domain-containing sensor histidine kinase n=1 Tax=Sodalis sp. dw_96 TaxID=2719794 RepID=UPI001BD37D5C|nr:PAS domain S-box protein [Sodalis sp. dw_96]
MSLPPPPYSRDGKDENHWENLPDIALNRIYDAIYIIDLDFNFKYINDRACSMLGYSRQELLNLAFTEIEHELKDPDVADLWWNMSTRPEGIIFTSQHTHRCGELIPVEVSSSHFSHNGMVHIICVVRDMRELKRQERLHNIREKQFRTLVENSPDMIARFDLKMACRYASPSILHYLGCGAAQVRGWRPTESVPLDEPGMRLFQLMARTLAGAECAEDELALNLHGNVMILHVRCVPEYNLRGEMDSILAVGRDITNIRQAENELREAHQQLRLLARNQETVREVERKHLAREIHDELGQHLSSLRVGLSLIRMQPPAKPAALQLQVEDLMNLMNSTIQVVRDVSTRLRPNMLNMGLIPALEWLRDEFVKRNAVDCVLIAPAEKNLQLDDASVTAAFRVVQESLTNITRHASASKVYIIVKRLQKTIIIQVKDNGVGFQTGRVRKNAFGLLGIKERGLMLGGEAEIESKPGEGTLVRLTFPLQTAKTALREKNQPTAGGADHV